MVDITEKNVDDLLCRWEQSCQEPSTPENRAMLWLIKEFRDYTGRKNMLDIIPSAIQRILVNDLHIRMPQGELDRFRANRNIGSGLEVKQKALLFAEESGRRITPAHAFLLEGKLQAIAQRWQKDWEN